MWKEKEAKREKMIESEEKQIGRERKRQMEIKKGRDREMCINYKYFTWSYLYHNLGFPVKKYSYQANFNINYL